jgi:hypothetical protein
MDSNVITNLIDAIIKDNRAATWSDNEIIEKLIKCGLEEKDFIRYGFGDFVEDYFNNDDEDDDNDFLQGLMDDAETEEMIGYWLEQLLDSFGKSNVDELTAEEISIEIDDIKGTISNESIVLGISEFAEKNIEQYEAYLEVLEEMLKNKEEN